MRFLVIGAGNIGSLYAAKLAQSGQEVTVLAQGARLEEIRQHGIVLEDAVSGERTRTPLRVVDRLGPDNAYDVVLVILPKQRIAELLPVLASNHHVNIMMIFLFSARLLISRYLMSMKKLHKKLFVLCVKI